MCPRVLLPLSYKCKPIYVYNYPFHFVILKIRVNRPIIIKLIGTILSSASWRLLLIFKFFKLKFKKSYEHFKMYKIITVLKWSLLAL